MKVTKERKILNKLHKIYSILADTLDELVALMKYRETEKEVKSNIKRTRRKKKE